MFSICRRQKSSTLKNTDIKSSLFRYAKLHGQEITCLRCVRIVVRFSSVVLMKIDWVQGGWIGFIEDILDTLLMFIPGEVGVEAEMKFLKDYMVSRIC